MGRLRLASIAPSSLSRLSTTGVIQHPLKNAIDYLYQEWSGKPAFVVSYGSRGGGLAATQLIEVLNGLRMRTLKEPASYKIIVDETDRIRENGDFDNGTKEAWKADGLDTMLETKFRELVALL